VAADVLRRLVPGAQGHTVDLGGWRTIGAPVHDNRRREKRIMVINISQFLMQIAGLVAWIFLAVAIYAIVEKVIERRQEQHSDTK